MKDHQLYWLSGAIAIIVSIAIGDIVGKLILLVLGVMYFMASFIVMRLEKSNDRLERKIKDLRFRIINAQLTDLNKLLRKKK